MQVENFGPSYFDPTLKTDRFETLLLWRKLKEEAMSEAKVEGEARLYKYLLSLLLFFYGGRLFFLAAIAILLPCHEMKSESRQLSFVTLGLG